MRPNFDISLPSIPGKTIKFKIQDIKQTSFGSRKQRFNENKQGLTKKFIESFNNFHESKDLSRLQQQTQASQSNSRISMKSTFDKERNQANFRHVIPEERKHMVSLHEKYKSYETPVLKQSRFDKGFTFNRAPKNHQVEKKSQVQNEPNLLTRKFVTDNYYFTSTIIQTPLSKGNDLFNSNHKIDQTAKRMQKPSAVFKNQTRQRVWERNLKDEVPGPGFYQDKQPEKQQIRTKKINSMKETKQPQNQYKKLKQLITSIVGEKIQQQEEKQVKEDDKKQRMQHMFIKDDRDRFGHQKYPIATRLNVPGPGSYDIMQGIQQQARKVTLVEEQRKLLKEWFNN